MSPPPYVVLVPVKAPAIGKSRLAVETDLRTALARAFALDTIAAARATEAVAEVVVVTSDHEFAATVADLGLAALPDADGLNGSLVAAAAAVRPRHPDAVVVALTADLPALTPADLGAALAAMHGDGPWFVADADGEGTALYAAAYDGFDPHFGPASRQAHLAAGATALSEALPSLRRDVDRTEHLADARRMGLGAHSAALSDG